MTQLSRSKAWYALAQPKRVVPGVERLGQIRDGKKLFKMRK